MATQQEQIQIQTAKNMWRFENVSFGKKCSKNSNGWKTNTPWKLTCHPKKGLFQWEIHLNQPLIFRGHVSFPGSTNSLVFCQGKSLGIKKPISTRDFLRVLGRWNTFFQAFFRCNVPKCIENYANMPMTLVLIGQLLLWQSLHIKTNDTKVSCTHNFGAAKNYCSNTGSDHTLTSRVCKT